jgi:hypothetical protein
MTHIALIMWLRAQDVRLRANVTFLEWLPCAVRLCTVRISSYINNRNVAYMVDLELLRRPVL